MAYIPAQEDAKRHHMTQKECVLGKLKLDGFITRNECLKVYISRLGAIICELKKDGYEFKKPEWVNGDYKYTLKV